MQSFAHPQSGAYHDKPDKKEPAHFFCPHVTWNQIREAGKNLQTDRDDQEQHRGNEQKMIKIPSDIAKSEKNEIIQIEY